MIVKTLFQNHAGFAPGEVEVKLMPGLPLLHVVGRPDAYIKESGMRLKSALRSCDLKWPKGHQIVVNLRPSYFPKHSSGVDLAIALGFLALTGQLADPIRRRLDECLVYGEIALDGRVFAPADFNRALGATSAAIISGESIEGLKDGSYMQVSRLNSSDLVPIKRVFDWAGFWQAPEIAELELADDAFRALCLTAHMGLNVLVAGPQGSGKTTWARMLHSLSLPPDLSQLRERQAMFGDAALQSRWRPCEAPHHSITPHAMIGGGNQIHPGVISAAHGGCLIMDEFLEFDGEVLEALRGPVESGVIEHSRGGEGVRYPARFQLIATTNLCPCGRLTLTRNAVCSNSLRKCRTVCDRLSGPVMDRFDIVLFTHTWLSSPVRFSSLRLKKELQVLRDFAKRRGETRVEIPDDPSALAYSHRRRASLAKVARGFADLERSVKVRATHISKARQLVTEPMENIERLFG